MAASVSAPTTEIWAVDFGEIGEPELEACARTLARFAVEKALTDLGLDIRSEATDDAGTT